MLWLSNYVGNSSTRSRMLLQHMVPDICIRVFPRGLPPPVFLSKNNSILPTALSHAIFGKGKKDNATIHMMRKLNYGRFLFYKCKFNKVMSTLVKLEICRNGKTKIT